VVPFKSPDGSVSALGGLLADRVAARLLRDGRITVLDRRYLGRVLGELRLRLSGLGGSGEGEAGGFSGADFLLLGSLEQGDGGGLLISSRLVETGTGRIAAQGSARLPLDGELRGLYAKVSEADTRAERLLEGLEPRRGGRIRVELLLSRASFRAGETARVSVTVSSPAAVYVYGFDWAGAASRLLPASGPPPVAAAARPLIFPGEELELAGTALTAAVPPAGTQSRETLRAFAVEAAAGDPLEGAASYPEIVRRLEASGFVWGEAAREFSVTP
jgi:hypothetical protein